MGTLQACVILAEELRQEFTLFTTTESPIPPDWIVRCSQVLLTMKQECQQLVQVLRDTMHGLCIAETAVSAFLNRVSHSTIVEHELDCCGIQVESFVENGNPKERVLQLKHLHAEMPTAQQDFICLLGYSKVSEN